MGIVWTILVGFVIGVIAKFLHPGKDNMGFIATILLGVYPSLVLDVIGPSVAALVDHTQTAAAASATTLAQSH